MYYDNKLVIGKNKEKELYIVPKMANRHGIITGASGSGKTTTVKVMAESFSSAGIPVFYVDVKGDLASICKEGVSNSNIEDRLNTLGISDFNQILGKDIPSGDLKFGTFNTPNTIYYLDGIYNIVKFMNNMPLGLIVGADTNENPVNNIKIASRGKNRAIINITSTDATNSIINVYMGNNITFENITFTGTKQGDNYHNPLFLVTLSASEVTFKNCIFQDLISSTADQIISFSKNQNQPAPNNVNMENCQFINCSAKNILKISDVNSINITNCIFDNVVSTEGYPISFSSSNVNWKDNTLLNLNAKTIFQISGSNTKVFDDVSFNVLTKTLTANTNNDIVAELVDTNGNHIYASV